MLVSVLGSNGLLSNAISRFCNLNGIEIDGYGRRKPNGISFRNFEYIDFLKQDINFNSLCKSDVIIYGAGAGIQSDRNEISEEIQFLNTELPIRILNTLQELNYKNYFISFGSYFEIGTNTQNITFNEEMILSGTNHLLSEYSISKRSLSKFISKFKGSFHNYHFVLPTVYGEDESHLRLIPYTINSLKNGVRLSLTSGIQVRQYLYVDEVSEIIFKSIACNVDSGIYNVAGNETLSVKELVSMVHDFFGKVLSDDVFGKLDRYDTGMQNLQLDGSLLFDKIGYFPTVRIVDVLNKY